MNINKKYAVFGVAAVIAVAGVIYFGTSANQQASVANVANKLSGPVIPIDEPTTPPTPVMTEFQWRKLCRDGKPHIRVMSPNGGEVYQADQMVNLKWKSCNLSQDARINGGLLENIPGSGNMSDVRIQFSNNASWSNNVTNNDGGEVFRISPAPMNGPLFGGKIYKIYLTVQDSNPSITDESDNTFTINTPDPWVALCADGKPRVQVLSPNGGEEYYAGSQITMKWKTCNIPASKKITLILNDTVHDIGGDLAALTANDGTELVTLPTSATWNPLYSGKFYKARASFATYGGYTPIQLTDESDALFSIKDISVQPDICLNIPGLQTAIPNGMIWDTPGNCVPGGTTAPNGGGTSSTTGITVVSFSALKPVATVNNSGVVTTASFSMKLGVTATGNDFYIPRGASFIRGNNTSTVPSLSSPTNGISFGILDGSNTYVDGSTAGNISTPASEISSSVNLVSGGIIDPSGRIKVAEGTTAMLDFSVNISEGVTPQDVVGQYKVGVLSVNGATTANGSVSNYNTALHQTSFSPAFQ